MELPYDPADKTSIIEFAKELVGKTLREACDACIQQHGYLGKGNFGQVLEKYYFLYEPNSDSQPDFKDAGLELKSTPLKRLNNKVYRSKERLVLNIINYLDIVDQDFGTSSFWKKNANILFVFYLYQAGYDILDHVVKLVDEWEFPETDLKIIRADWEKIKRKIVAGKAHELSEGDTFYLGACTKGSKGGNLRPQPNSEIPAKQRAYSLKQGYVNHILASLTNEDKESYGKLIPPGIDVNELTIEKTVISKFDPYLGKTPEQIASALGLEVRRTLKGTYAKNFYATLTKVILGIAPDKEVEEFKKADIVVKTVRLKDNGLPKEDISFPCFKYEGMIKREWDSSQFKAVLERKFLFVFYQFENDELILKKVKFWNMPYQDIEEARKVWERTKFLISEGSIVKEVKGNVRYTFFPDKTFNSIAHVRPHALNKNDTYPLPIPDRLTKADEYTKHCFWLNNTYIRDEIYLK